MMNDTTDIELAALAVLEAEANYTSAMVLRLPTAPGFLSNLLQAQSDYEDTVLSRTTMTLKYIPS
jgi:hypothetical protein